MIRLMLLILSLVTTAPALAEPGDRPSPSQRRGPWGMGLSDGLHELMAEIYRKTPPGQSPPARYLSPALRALLEADARRPQPEVGDWLRGEGEPPVDELAIHVLNTSGSIGGQPAYASVSVSNFMRPGPGWGRRFRLIDQGGYWVIDDVVIYPGDVSLRSLLAEQRNCGAAC
jgi:hypothetical protein